MSLLCEILFWSAFTGGISLVVFPVAFSSLFFKWLDYVVDKSEGDVTSDW
jgi:hypothetical protein